MAGTHPKPLEGRELLLCVTGGIACYKSADLASRLVQAGAGVNVAMTASARRFVEPLTFQTLTERRVYTDLWTPPEDFSAQHVSLTGSADLLIIAPATANTLAKMTVGIADNLVTSLALAACGACEILVAPAMNTRMWNAPATQANMKTLIGRGVHVIGPATGRLACGDEGPGRMSEPEEIFEAVVGLVRAARG